MLKEGELYFNNDTSLNLNLYLEEYPVVPRANEEYEKVPVDGRSGDLIINKGTYPDRTIPFTFTIVSNDIEVDFDRVEEWLTEIKDKRLFWGNSDKCFIVKKVNIGDFQQEFTTFGKSTINFLCEPFRSDPDSIIYTITASGFKFNYSGNIPAEPLIKVYGSGNIQLTINGETIQIDNVTNYVEIDSKLMQFRNQDLTSKDNDALGDFPLFSKGENIINYTGSITKIIVEYTTKYR
ncbi:distal tail protein Dit [Clostridium sp. HBUAS56017]|uniref:distal tail protein Dit n=1 Tax=Clostridium sp. HBUAS56017 TaxID=2571128 RepID=UPI0011788B7E|nr:distal tail protein Dit [Clostridium sp. HBUAS56017]